MIRTYKEKFNLYEYLGTIGRKTNIHKVSYFCKDSFKDITSSRILIIDFEFSMNKIIFEIGGFILDNNKIVRNIYEEYSLPKGEPVWDFEKNGFTDKPVNKGKEQFLKKDQERLDSLIESVDYVIVHNYVAEAQCILKYQLPNEKYNITNSKIFNEDKFICTSYTLKNKYFKSLGMEGFSNSGVSEHFNWKIKDRDKYIKVKNKDLNVEFCIDKPEGMESKLHNSFYDSVVTLTNLISIKKIGENF